MLQPLLVFGTLHPNENFLIGAHHNITTWREAKAWQLKDLMEEESISNGFEGEEDGEEDTEDLGDLVEVVCSGNTDQ